MSQDRPVLGIDLGTSNTCVAFVDGDQVRVVTDERGRGVTPSVVSLDPQGEFIVGHFAKAQRITNPYQTIYSAKRLLGWDFNNPVLQEAIKLLSYQVVSDAHGRPVCDVNGREVKPHEVSAQVLFHVKELAEAYLGMEVREAVITVPAHFNDRQRKETLLAAQLAQLDVLRLINEPTAAALAYGYGYDSNATIAIYDFGGGTFDISVLEIEDNVFEVIATGGDSYLGGDDINQRIANHVVEAFTEQTGIALKGDKMAMQRILDAAEKAKIELSRVEETVLNLPRIAPNIDFNAHLYHRLSRETLDELCYDLIEETLEICKATFAEARISPQQVDDVVLVGGQTRMPLVKEMVSRFFGKTPNDSLHPHHVVAVGAAIQSHALLEMDSDILLVDVTPLSLGIEALGGVFRPVIPKNTKVPHRFSQVFTTTSDYQTEVRIKVFQGEDRYTQGNHPLGEFVLTGIREALRREPQIDVTFHLDASGVLHVSATDLDTGNAQAIQIQGVIEADPSMEQTDIKEGGYTKAGGRTRDLGKHGINALASREQPSSPSMSTMRARNSDDSGSMFAGGPQTNGAGPMTGGSGTGTGRHQVPDLPAGTVVGGRYVLEKPVGAGAFGAVYRAVDQETGHVFALKTLMPGATQADEAAVERFQREAELMSRFDHPNLVQIHNFGRTDDGGLFMVMEFIDGRTLHRTLKTEKRLAPVRAVQIVRQALLGLEEAHNQGIIHRDLKPGNIMLFDTDEAPDQVKVLDFGVAKMMRESQAQSMEELTVAGKVLGTPRYIAPEQLASNGGNYPCSDVYSLGLILYRMVTGRRAIRGKTVPEILAEQVSPQPVIDEGDPLVPPPLFPVLRAATEKDWNRRLANASAFIEALDQVDMRELARWRSPVPVEGHPESAIEPVDSEEGGGGVVQQIQEKVRASGLFKALFKK